MLKLGELVVLKSEAAAVVLLLAFVVLAGCAASPEEDEPVALPMLAEPPAGPTVVHDVAGRFIDPSAFGGELPQMVQRLVDDVYSWEPTIGVGPDGTAYYRSSDALTAPPRGYLYKSSDLGESWQDVSPSIGGVVPLPVMTGDPFLHVDPETGRIFHYDQQSHLLCNQWAISDDEGTSWDVWDTCQEDGSYGDHPAITTGPPQVSELEGYPRVVYFCASIGGNSTCRVSLDGGYTYQPPVMSIEPCVDDQGQSSPSQHGHARTDAAGNVYVAKAACNGVLVGISEDDGQSWRTIKINNTGWTHQKWPEFNEHEANVAADSAGNIYVAVVGDDGLPYLVVSKDRGQTWSDPMVISRPGVTATNFVHLVAGDAGRIAVLYVGTTVEGGYGAPAAAMEEATWNAYVAFSLTAADNTPVFASAQVNPEDDPIKRGPCHGRCAVREGPLGRGILQPGMYDFLDIAIDPSTGGVWLALVDLCHGACTDGSGAAEEGHEAKATAGVQVSGASLLERYDP